MIAAIVLVHAAGAAAQAPGDAGGGQACVDRPTRPCIIALALAAARQEGRPLVRDILLRQIAALQFASGAPAAARATSALIPETASRRLIDALDEIERLARAGRDDEALRAAESIGGSEWRAAALLRIARIQARSGRPAEATVARLGPGTRIEIRAVGLAIIDRADAALAAAAASPDPDATRVSIADEHAAAGRRDRALAAVRSIGGPAARGIALQEIAERFGDADLAAAAVPLVQPLGQDHFRSALGTLIRAQVGSGRTADAIATARTIDDLAERAKALAAVARLTGERALTLEAGRIAETVGDSAAQQHALREVAAAMAADGRPDEALALARGLTPIVRDQALFQVSAEIAKRHGAGAAAPVAVAIASPDLRGAALLAIAARLAD